MLTVVLMDCDRGVNRVSLGFFFPVMTVPARFLLLLAVVLLVVAAAPADAQSGRRAHAEPVGLASAGSGLNKAYCPASGGSRAYESLRDVQWTVADDVLSVVVEVAISNPDGCVSGEPCESYDSSPEYINAWVDWDEDGVWQPRERVLDLALSGYQSINYGGSMTGYGQAPIPPEAYGDGSGAKPMRVMLSWGDDINDPCTSSWAWGDVRDVAVVVEERDVFVSRISGRSGTHGISEVPDGVVWDVEYPQGCPDVPPVERRTGLADYPIVTSINNGVVLDVGLSTCPEPSAVERVPYSWSIPEAGLSGAGEWNGASSTLAFGAPPTVGAYTLVIRYGQQPEREVRRALWVTYAAPDLSGVRGEMFRDFGLLTGQQPKREWYRNAVAWAQGQSSVGGVLSGVLGGAYQSGRGSWKYAYKADGTVDQWPTLITGGGIAECLNFSEAFAVTAATAGIVTNYHPVFTDYRFITDASSRAFDPDFPGNARQRDSGDVSAFNRYVFQNHQLRLGPDGRYYDVTFNGVYTGDRAFIDYTFPRGTPETGGIPTSPEGARLFGGAPELSGVYASWPTYQYVLPGDDYLTGDTEGAVALRGAGPLAPMEAASAPEARWGAARAAGDAVVDAVDGDGDGLAETFRVRFTLASGPAGARLPAVLVQGGAVVSASPDLVSSRGSVVRVPDSGAGEVTVDFSGEDVYRNGALGAYTVVVGLGPDAAEVHTPEVDPEAFGASPYRVLGVTDVVSDGDLLIRAAVEVRTAGPIRLRATLKGASGKTITARTETADGAPIGQTPFELRLSGRDIAAYGADGPYTVRINGADGRPVEFETGAHSASDFTRPFLKFSGTGADAGVDTDGDGLFDALRVALDIDVDSSATYGYSVALVGASGGRVAFAMGEATLSAGAEQLTVDFGGAEIRRAAQTGAFRVEALATLTSGDRARTLARGVPVGYTTASYAPEAFEYAAVLDLEVLEGITQGGTDADGDGLFDTYEVRPRIRLSEAGGVIGVAGLYDAAGRRVATGRGFAAVAQGAEAEIAIEFDGRLLFGSLIEGPLYIRDVFLYPTGDLARGEWVEDLGATAPLVYTDFEPAAVLMGRVEDPATGEAAVGRFVQSEAVSDAVDAEGTYRLVLLSDATIEARLPHDDDPDATWTLVLDGEELGEGDAATVSLTVGEVRTLDFLADVDTTPPTLIAAPSVSVWPPNHKYETLRVAEMVLAVTDPEAGDLGVGSARVIRVWSDEPENASGDGNTTDDIVIADDAQSVSVRRERQGGGNGRVYTVVVGAADPAGNVGETTFQIHVPTSRNRDAFDDGAEKGYTVESGVVFGDLALTRGGATQKQGDRAGADVAVFPNPATRSVTIAFETETAGPVTVSLVDMLGRAVVRVVEAAAAPGPRQIQVNLAAVAAGPYLVVVDDATGVRTSRVVVAR